MGRVAKPVKCGAESESEAAVGIGRIYTAERSDHLCVHHSSVAGMTGHDDNLGARGTGVSGG